MKTKHIFSLMLALSMSSTLLAGCTKPPEASPAPEAEKPTPVAEEAAPIPDKAFTLTVKLYLPNEEADGFIAEEADVSADAGPQELVELLIQRGALPADSRVLELRQDGNSLNVSMNQAYCDKVASTGTAGEAMLLGSLVNTLLTFYDADELYIDCEGEDLATGHNVYDFPLVFMEDNKAEEQPLTEEKLEIEP